MRSDGSLVLLDKFGYLFTAQPQGAAAYQLDTEPLAYLGAGRPLGFHVHGNDVLVCDSVKVRASRS